MPTIDLNSRTPETLAGRVSVLGASARAATAGQAAGACDVVVVAIPPKANRAVPVQPLAGKAFNNVGYRELATQGQPACTWSSAESWRSPVTTLRRRRRSVA